MTSKINQLVTPFLDAAVNEKEPIPGDTEMSDRDPNLDHLFKTTISREKFEAVLARSCKAPFSFEIVAADPTVIPQERVYGVAFSSLEDRDRVRIAMRFVEKEVAEAVRTPAPTGAAARRVQPAGA